MTRLSSTTGASTKFSASTLVGASSVEQLAKNLAALGGAPFSDEELIEIDRYALESHVDLWRSVSTL